MLLDITLPIYSDKFSQKLAMKFTNGFGIKASASNPAANQISHVTSHIQ